MAFVWKHNIHIWNNGTISAITKDGGVDKLYGVTDWVYEEEVMGPNALWFSPDGEYIAFLSFDDSQVPLYTVTYYMNNHKWPQAYPKELDIRYPKPGYPNPIVKAGLFKVSNPGTIIDIPLSTAWPADDIVVGEVAWVTGSHEHLILRCFNRVQNRDKHILYQVGSNSAQIVRERDGTDGWISNTKAIRYVGEVETPNNTGNYYLDLSDQDGWSHIYLYPVKGGKPVQVTSGNWEVRSVSRVEKKTGLVHYLSSEQHPTQSHLYTVSMTTLERTLTVNNTKAAFFDATFSTRGDYFVLSYLGPNVPYQEVYATNSTREPLRILEDNADLVSRLHEYALPTSKFFDMPHPSGFNLSARLIFPPNFSPDKKYPILLTPYGGPGSQEVRHTFGTVSYPSYLSSDPQLEYVTFTVDNRGTGWRGRRFRNTLAGAMGTVDADDQIWAAQKLAADNPWVDAAHIGIWGWSNGGYLSAKVVEKGSDIISFAAATAPTSDCRLYDSIYAERYMGMPQDNADVYDRAAIRNATGFKNIAGRVLIQHGTGDDNVHFAHTAALFDTLVGAGVPPEKVQATFFTDSDHGIRYNRANEYLFKQLTRLLREEKDRVPAKAKKYRMDPESEPKEVEEKPLGTKPNILQDPQYTARFRMGGMPDLIMS
jgi:dipeptidyl-peptidase 4